MNEHPPELAEETMLQAIRRRYAYLASWLLRLNRLPEPSRLPEPTRIRSPDNCSSKTIASSTPNVNVKKLSDVKPAERKTNWRYLRLRF